MKKGKYLQIFNYLLEFSKIRSNAVRDIEAQKTQYPEVFWLNDIPESEIFENVIRPDFNSENEYWVKIIKPKEPSKPLFATLPKNLQLWVEPSSLLDEAELPFLKESIEVNGQMLSIKSFPKIEEEFQDYVNEKWLDDLIQYNDRLVSYKREFDKFNILNETYKQLFRIYNKGKQFGEEYELVVGVGLLNYREASGKTKVFRHVITQRVDINFEYSQKESQICISPNLESSPQIETDSIIDLFEQFDSQNIIDAEKSVENYIKEKEMDHLFSNGLILDSLQIFADTFSPEGRFISKIEKPVYIENKPTIFFSPALLLRKRNTKSYTALYEKIIQNIEKEEQIEIPSMDDLIGFIGESAERPDSDLNHLGPDSAPVYFPKEYNQEQIEIIEKARRSSKVLVQGPPGTGKSHTIANLICHLLANGKKILITAYTKRALEVLKEKLPPEFQNLTVNLLSGDSSSIQDLQASVNSINDELSRAEISKYKVDIERLNTNLSETRKKIANYTNEIIKIREKATRKQEVNSAYIGTLIEVAERLEKDSISFKWYKDSFCDIGNKDIVNDLQILIELNKSYNQVDVSEFTYSIPSTEHLPKVEQMRQYSELAHLLDNNSEKEKHISIECSDYNKLESMLFQLAQFYDQASSIHIDFAEIIINSYLVDNKYIWEQKLELSSQILSRIQAVDLKQIDRDIEITYGSNHNWKQLKNDAHLLLNYLNEGNLLSGVSFALKKPFLSKELKERLYFIESIRVNGSPCDTKDEFLAVIQDIELQQDFEEISQLWEIDNLEGYSYFNKLSYFSNVHAEVTRLIRIIEDSEKLRLDIEEFVNLNIRPFDREGVNDLIEDTEYNRLLKTAEKLQEKIKEAESYLNQESFHPIAQNILRDIQKMDYNSYEHLIKDLASIATNKMAYQKFDDLKNRLATILPNLVDNILSGEFTTSNLPGFEKALFFRHAQNEINKLMDSNHEDTLIANLKELEKRENKLIAEIASKKAWCTVLEGLQANRSLRQHLEAWVQAVKRIGKTGKGKRALKFRKEAQKQMDKCKFLVPCWIMPLYKVAETIQPEQGMYDYVIIDEASQLGPDAIFLLYISKNIIIVGDDKQTSPEYVGVDANTMTPHINRHLKNIPFANYYGTEFSFFDHARRFCDGITVLREHFRCMPEIIEFSNKNFYAPDGKGLYPLTQYSENRLEPLQTVFCADGYVDGKGARIVNEPEANSIVDTIANLVRDKRYDGKSFGVIVLQGNHQAALIENLLLKKIGEAEFHKRKLVCGNSSSFQGDERDVIFLSLVTAHNHDRSALTRPEDERRFNVAVSRAKEQIWLFHSVEQDDLSNTNDLRYKILDHFKNYNSRPLILSTPIERKYGTPLEPFESWFEVDVYNDIVIKGYSVISQYEVAKGKYRIDLVVLLPDGTKIAIECDGDKWHGVEQHQDDIMRQKVLERCGWQFFRVRGHEYYTDRMKALKELWELLSEANVLEKDQPSQEIKNLELFKASSDFIKSYCELNEVSSAKEPDNTYEDELTEEIEIIKENQDEEIFDDNNLEGCSEVLIFTNKHNVYKVRRNGFFDKSDVVAGVEFEEGEKPIYITGTKNYSGFLLTAYENGKIAKVFMSSYMTKTKRKRLKNAYNDTSKLIFIEHIQTDIDLIAISTIDKVLLFNTSDIGPKESTKSLGVQVLKLKNNSRLKLIKKPHEVHFEDINYYRKNMPAIGYYLQKNDKY